MAAAALEGERFAESTLAFANLLLFSGPLPPPRGAAVVPVNEDDLLQALRDALLPAVDVNPVSFSLGGLRGPPGRRFAEGNTCRSEQAQLRAHTPPLQLRRRSESAC